MDRRQFLAASSLTVAVGANSASAGSPIKNKDYFEQRWYRCSSPAQKAQLSVFFENALLPALDRQGIKNVGVFDVLEPADNINDFYVLIPHKKHSFLLMTQKLMADKKFLQDGKEFLDLTSKDKGFERIESSLLVAFEKAPKLEITNRKPSRIFQLRCYESHSIIAGQKKIDMFNNGGEIELFRKCGMQPVYFGEMIIGKNVPNLTYMLVFDDMKAKDVGWQKFINSPEWDNLKKMEKYKDTVSKIYNYFLKPTPYSGI